MHTMAVKFAHDEIDTYIYMYNIITYYRYEFVTL